MELVCPKCGNPLKYVYKPGMTPLYYCKHGCYGELPNHALGNQKLWEELIKSQNELKGVKNG